MRPGITFLQEQRGSGLLAVMVMSTVLTLVLGTVLAAYALQYRFLRRDAHRLQSRYAAEAGLYVALDRMQQDPGWRPDGAVLELPEGQTSRVSAEPFGGYLWVRAESTRRSARSIVRALVGEVPPAAFQHALWLWDTGSILHVAGSTRITGDVVVGRRGLKRSTFRSRRYTGRIDGAIIKVKDLSAPYFDETSLREAVDLLERYLERSPEPSGLQAESLPSMPSRNVLVRVRGDLRLTAADSLLLETPLTVAAGGDLTVEGPLRLLPGTILTAGGTLRLEREIDGHDVLFYGREGVVVARGSRCAGQIFSQRHLRVAENAYLRYPALLFVSGHLADGGSVVVEDGATVDGTIVLPRLEAGPEAQRGRVFIAPTARVRGAIYNGQETELHGSLYGSLLTRRLFFYDFPSGYVNWLKDAVIDVERRPADYLLPVGFRRERRLEVLRWEIHTEDA